MRVGLNILHYLLMILLLIAAAIGMTLYFALQGSLPQHEGIVIVENLEQKVDIRRDAKGVPSIESTDRESVLFGLGFVQAQDQFLTMDLLRRASVGRLSELLGATAKGADQQRFYYGLEALTQQVWHNATALEQALLTAYSAGVNAGLDQQTQPPLFYGLRSMEPQPWRPEDAIRVLLSFLVLPHEAQLLAVLESATQHGAQPTLTQTLTPSPDGFQLSLQTATLLPIVAPWYQVQWRTFAQSPWLQGMTLPGLPTLLMGRHDALAWSLNSSPEPPFQWLRLSVMAEQFWHPEWGWTGFEYQTQMRPGDQTETTFRQTPWGSVVGTDDQGQWLVLSWPGLTAEALSLSWLHLDQHNNPAQMLSQIQALSGTELITIDHSGAWALRYDLTPVQPIIDIHPDRSFDYLLGKPQHAVLQASRLNQPVLMSHASTASVDSNSVLPMTEQPQLNLWQAVFADTPWQQSRQNMVHSAAMPALWQHPLNHLENIRNPLHFELTEFQLMLTLNADNLDQVAGARQQSWHPLQPFARTTAELQPFASGPTRSQLTLLPGR